jgi:phage terminase large subunit
VVKKINFSENPRFPQELKDDAELMKQNDPELFRHIYGGEPVSDSALAIIKPMWIEAALDAHIKLGISASGGKLAGFDVSDDGPDANALIWRHGVIVQGIEEWRDADPVSAARYVHSEAVRLGIELVTYDDIGVGAGAKGAFREEQANMLASGIRGHARTRAEGFNAASAVLWPDQEYQPGKKNKDMFYNIKAQAWWYVSDRFRNTYNAVQGKPYEADKLICIPSNLPFADKLCAELAQPRREYLNGKVKVEKKEDMKKRGIPSPNLADALIMAYFEQGGFDLRALL